MPTEKKKPDVDKKPQWKRRALWFLAFWLGGVLTLAAISFALRSLLSIPY